MKIYRISEIYQSRYHYLEIRRGSKRESVITKTLEADIEPRNLLKLAIVKVGDFGVKAAYRA